jgi:tetratricopeptide (TPR) repeat protein
MQQLIGEKFMIFLDSGTLLNAQLLQEPIKSLCAAVGIHGSIHLLHEFSDGFSETRVVLGENRSGPNDLQPFHFVFKIGTADVLRDEVHHYLDFIAHARASAAFVPIWKAELTLKALPLGPTLAAIAYSHASDVFGAEECVSFKTVFREGIRGDRPLSVVAGIIESLARIMGSLYSEPVHCYAHEIALYYLEHWAPDYQVTADHLVNTEGYPLLTLQRLNPNYFRRETPSIGAVLRKEAESAVKDNQIDIVLPRCFIAKVERDRLVSWVNSPADLTLQVNTLELPLASYEKLSKVSTISLWAPRNISRYDFYLRNVKHALPSLNVEAPTFKVGQLYLHNPLMHFSAPLLAATKPPSSTFSAPGHGDLHPGNVLVAGTSPAIIDYGKSATKLPVGIDAARFFGGLVRDVLAEELSFEDLALVLAYALGLDDSFKEDNSPVSRASYLLRLVREKLVPGNVPESQVLWPVHLYGYSWIGLKWAHSSPESYRACFLLAGIALQCLLGPAPTEQEKPIDAPSGHDDEKLTQLITVTQPIRPEGPAEILILVSQFYGSADYDPTIRIYSTLSDNIFDILPGLARVERVDDVVSSRRDAVELAKRYSASMIVWGTFDNMGVSPRYEVTRDSLIIKRSMIQLDEATRHQLSERFEPYITQNLAAEISFLSLKAVAEMCVLNLNTNEALKVYKRALSLVPDRERARALGATDLYRSLAALYFLLNQDTDAVEANDNARELDPGDLITELQRLQIRSRMEKKSNTQQIKELKSLLRARIEANTDKPGVVESLKVLMIKLEPLNTPADFRKFAEAEAPKMKHTSLQSLNKQFEKDVAVHLQRAQGLIEADKFQKSLSEIRSALRLNPRCADAYGMRANVLAALGRFKDALKDIETAQRLNPKESITHALRGDILCNAFQDYQGALQEYEKAFELGIVKDMVMPEWGTSMIQLGRGDEAMKLARDWNLNPGNSLLFIFRSQYHRKKGEYEIALRDVDQAIQLSENDQPWSLRERAEVYEAMGRREQAIQDLEQAIKFSVEGTHIRNILRQRLNNLSSLLVTTEGGASDSTEVYINTEAEKVKQEHEPNA